MGPDTVNVLKPPRHTYPSGSFVYRIRPDTCDATFDPILQVDHFYMAHPTWPVPPVAGMAEVTYLFADSETDVIHRDALGQRNTLRAGGLRWCQAGRGVLHEEAPASPGKWAHGLHMLVNLEAHGLDTQPRVVHLDRESIPKLKINAGSLRLVAGAYGDVESPMTRRLATSIELYDIHVLWKAPLTIAFPKRDLNILLIVVCGSLRIGTQHLHAGEVGHIKRLRAQQLTFDSESATTHVVVLAGTPIDEPALFRSALIAGSTAQGRDAVPRFRIAQPDHLAPRWPRVERGHHRASMRRG